MSFMRELTAADSRGFTANRKGCPQPSMNILFLFVIFFNPDVCSVEFNHLVFAHYS